jgi:predicted secreted protein
MSKINGSALLMAINQAAPGDPADWKTVCGATSHSISFSTELPDATSKCNDGHDDFIAGLKATTVTVDAMEAPTDDISFVDVFELWQNRTEVLIQCYLTESATSFLSGIAVIQSLDQTADMEQPVTWSASFKVKSPGLVKSPVT